MTLTIYITVNAEPNLRFALSRWTISPIPGTHIGDLTHRVAHEIWDRITHISEQTNLYACMIRSSPEAPQGFEVLTCGQHRRIIIDIDNTRLVGITPNDPEEPDEQADNKSGTAP